MPYKTSFRSPVKSRYCFINYYRITEFIKLIKTNISFKDKSKRQNHVGKKQERNSIKVFFKTKLFSDRKANCAVYGMNKTINTCYNS